jgi:hypothetical protein
VNAIAPTLNTTPDATPTDAEALTDAPAAEPPAQAGGSSSTARAWRRRPTAPASVA